MLKKLIRGITTNYAALEESAEPALRPMTVSLPIADVANGIEAWASEAPNWSYEAGQPDGADTQIHLTRTTSLCRFVDDVRITLTPDGEQTLVNAESQSRIGVGDLGQNPRNLRELTAMLRQLA